MKLTQDQIDRIYQSIACGFSQRDIATIFKHGRGTIARYLDTREMVNQYTIKVYENEMDMLDNWLTVSLLKNKVSLYRNLTIIGFIGFIAQILINIFF